MAEFLFTMFLANDLGLPTRMVPIARALADRGHEVAIFNPALAPGKLIAEAGFAAAHEALQNDLTQKEGAWNELTSITGTP